MKHNDYLMQIYKLNEAKQKREKLQTNFEYFETSAERARKAIVITSLIALGSYLLSFMLGSSIVSIALLMCVSSVTILGPFHLIMDYKKEKTEKKLNECDKAIETYKNNLTTSMLLLPAPVAMTQIKDTCQGNVNKEINPSRWR